jgi:hypothetical protein
MPGIEMKLKKIPIKFEHFQLIGIFLMFKEHWVDPEKIHTPHGGNFRRPKGEGGKMS